MVVYLSPRRIFTIIPWLQHLFCLNISHFSMHLFWHWAWLYQGQDVKLVAQPRGSIRDPHSTPSPGSCPAGSWGDFQGFVSPSPWMSMTCSEGPTFAGLLLWQWRMKLGLSSGPGSGTYQLCVRLIICTSRCFVRMKWDDAWEILCGLMCIKLNFGTDWWDSWVHGTSAFAVDETTKGLWDWGFQAQSAMLRGSGRLLLCGPVIYLGSAAFWVKGGSRFDHTVGCVL